MSKRTRREMPSHMLRAVQRMEKLSGTVDLVLDVRDARAPLVSHCRLLPKLFPGTPVVAVLAKADLADRDAVRRWREVWESDYPTLIFHPGVKGGAQKFWKDIIAAAKPGPGICKALIAGIPNVGKSTLINFLAGKRGARVGAKPGITRDLQLLRGPDNMYLFDTPGVLTPTVATREANIALTLIGALQDSFFDVEEAARFLLEWGLPRYAGLMAKHFDLDSIPESPEAFAGVLARRRGFLLPGAALDLERSSRLLVGDFSVGKLRGINLETPEAPIFGGEAEEG